MLDVKQIMTTEIDREFVKKELPDGGEFKSRCDMLQDFARTITCRADMGKPDLPQVMLDKYNRLINQLYDLADAEYEMYKIYR